MPQHISRHLYRITFSIIIIPALITLCWQVTNKFTIGDDSTAFIDAAHNICEKMQTESFPRKLLSVYEIRPYGRPIIFSVFFIPFLIMTFGNMHIAITCLQVGFSLLFAFYSYFILRETLSPLRSAVCVLILASVPWFANTTYIPITELAWMTFILASYFHILKSELFSKANHTFFAAFFLTMVLLVRPVLSEMLLFLPAVFYVVFMIKSNRITIADIAFAVLVIALSAIIISGPLIIRHTRPWVQFCIALPIIIGYNMLPRFYRISRRVVLFVSIVAGSLIVWWSGPNVQKLYEWVYENSYGPMANALDLAEGKVGILMLILETIRTFHPVPLLLITILTVISINNTIWSLLKEPTLLSFKNLFSNQTGVLLCGSLLMMLPILIVLWRVGIGDYRRLIPGFVFLYLALLAISLRNGGKLPKLRLGVAIMLGLLLVIRLGANALAIPISESEGMDYLMGRLYAPDPRPDGNAIMLNMFPSLGVPSGSLIHVYTLSLYEGDTTSFFRTLTYATYRPRRIYEPSGLMLVSRLHGNPYNFGCDIYDTEIDGAIRALPQGTDVYFLIDIDRESRVSAMKVHYTQLTGKLIDAHERGILSNYGLRLIREFSLRGRKHALYVAPHGK